MADRRPDPGLSRRSVLRGLLLGGAGAATLAACGVPSAGKPHVDGDGPSGYEGSRNDNMKPPSPVGITDAQDFVRTFLTALAAPSDEQSRSAAIANARTFLTAAAQDEWQAGPTQLTIVRVVSIGKPAFASAGVTVTVDMVPVGQLTAGGWVSPAPGNPTTAQFQLVHNDIGSAGISWRIDAPLPPALANSLLLSSEGLSAPRYYPQLVYYWDAGNAGLVPDLRYLPSVGLKLEQQPTQIVNWLIKGPSEWLEPAVTPLPAGTSLKLPNVAMDKTSNSWVVDFANLQNVDPARVAGQLQWSLRPRLVHLQIAEQDKPADPSRFLDANLADGPALPGVNPVPYFIVAGQVRQGTFPYDIPPLFAKVNDPSLVSAGASRDLRLGAVVKSQKGNRFRLQVGQLPAGDSGQGADFADVALETTGATMSRPVWLNLASPRLLVAADGALFSVSPGGQWAKVPIDGGFSFQVSAFAVAPDGRRIALVSDRRPAVAALTFTTDTVVVGTPRFIDAGGLTELTAVAWSRVHCLALAGRPGPDSYGLVEVTLDGAVAASLSTGLFDRRVTQLAACPPLPSRTMGLPGPIVVQTESTALQVQGGNAEQMTYQPATPATPAPGTTPGPGQATAHHPFYLD